MHPYLIVGDGRLATHLRHYLTLRGLKPLQWSRKLGTEASLEKLSLEADFVLLALKDDALVEFIHERPYLYKRASSLIHFSGSLSTELAVGLHPLMTFGTKLYDLSIYETIAFIGERGKAPFREVFPELPNPSFEIDPPLKPLYHSLCVMSGNFTVLLWQKFFEELKSRFGIPAGAALPYLRQIARNLEEDPDRALTGPIQRRDHATLERNHSALAGDPYQKVFESFVKAVLQ